MVRATFCDCGVRRVPRVLETAFHEIDVQRIDIGEPRDTVPLVISDKGKISGFFKGETSWLSTVATSGSPSSEFLPDGG